MKSLRLITAALAALCLMTVAAFAADASGTWKWSTPGRNGGPARESTLTLVQKDGALTGKLSTPGRDGAAMATDISAATVKGDEISFNVEREFNGNKFVTKYTGKIAGDTIKGSLEMPGRNGGEPMKREWEATKAK
jgi:hypothetical protein